MALKDDYKTAIQACADASGSPDLRVGIGALGNRLLIRGATFDTGQAYVIPGFLDCLLEGLATKAFVGHEEDTPPTAPSTKDDEFQGSSLNTKWSWTKGGAPASGSEVWGLNHGRLFANVEPDSGTGTPVFDTEAHVLLQSAPAGDFTITAKINAARLVDQNRFGIIITDAAESNLLQLVMARNTTNLEVWWERREATIWTTRIDPITFPFSTGVLQLQYVSTTNRAFMLASVDGTVFANIRDTGNFHALSGWTPSKIGLLFWSFSAAGGNNFLRGASVDWFRVA
jgi:hypothetical protein